MRTFPLGKKTQLFIQKTERFANIEFGLISFLICLSTNDRTLYKSEEAVKHLTDHFYQ